MCGQWDQEFDDAVANLFGSFPDTQPMASQAADEILIEDSNADADEMVIS